MKGILYLLPSPLGESPVDHVITPHVRGLVNRIGHFAVEDLRTARRILKREGLERPVDELEFYPVNEHTGDTEVNEVLKVLLSGMDVGLMSEAGVPAVADPGTRLIGLAHRNDIRVVPLTGPSSILLALMASGLNGQEFSFHGYIPVKSPMRMQVLKKIEKQARTTKATQIFMETPYRNMSLLKDILGTMQDDTRLCIASKITDPGEYIKTRTIGEWRNNLPDLHKRPAVFLVGPSG